MRRVKETALERADFPQQLSNVCNRKRAKKTASFFVYFYLCQPLYLGISSGTSKARPEKRSWKLEATSFLFSLFKASWQSPTGDFFTFQRKKILEGKVGEIQNKRGKRKVFPSFELTPCSKKVHDNIFKIRAISQPCKVKNNQKHTKFILFNMGSFQKVHCKILVLFLTRYTP